MLIYVDRIDLITDEIKAKLQSGIDKAYGSRVVVLQFVQTPTKLKADEFSSFISSESICFLDIDTSEPKPKTQAQVWANDWRKKGKRK